MKPEEAMSLFLDRIVQADAVGLDIFGVGEHHREEFLDSAPVVVLAAAAALTKNIRLTSAVTVLSAADPVHVFEAFATLDLISKGRAEIVAGRGVADGPRDHAGNLGVNDGNGECHRQGSGDEKPGEATNEGGAGDVHGGNRGIVNIIEQNAIARNFYVMLENTKEFRMKVNGNPFDIFCF